MAEDKKFASPDFSVLLTTFLTFTLDWITKYVALRNLTHGVSIPFIPGLLHLTLTTNTGAAFSLGRDNATVMTVLASLMTLILIYWVVLLKKTEEGNTLLDKLGMGCLIGGALGNLVDRFTQGRVTDFLEFSFISFPIFNLADVAIDTGIFLILFARFKQAKASRVKLDSKLETDNDTKQ